jgi:L-cysteine desulfidase
MQGTHKYFDIKYKGPVSEFKSLLKKKMSFDLKDIGNDTLYVKVKVENYEDMMLFLKQTRKEKSNVLKDYQEIDQQTYDGALQSLANILK